MGVLASLSRGAFASQGARDAHPVMAIEEPGSAMIAVYQLIDTIIQLYMWALIISVILSWLVQFNVINTSNRFVYAIGDFLYRITEPVLGRIRSVIPPIGGIDLSPLIVILALVFLRNLLPDIFGLR